MPDYANGKIYTIRNRNDPTLIYVGSTCQLLSKRFYSHKFESKEKKARKLYSKVEDWNDWYIELYETYPCKSREQLTKREGEVIRQIGTLNTCIAGRTPNEYYQENKDEILMKQKDYRDENKEKIQQWREENHEKITEYEAKRAQDPVRIEYRKQFRENYREIFNEKARERITCECGCIVNRSGLTAHKRTLKHLELLQQS